MFSQSPVTWRPRAAPNPFQAAWRALAARSLRRASVLLERLASRMAMPAQAVDTNSALEFHADAGAPEGGALYLDGRLVGWLDGVNRL